VISTPRVLAKTHSAAQYER